MHIAPPTPPERHVARPARRRGGWTLRLTSGGVMLLLFVNMLILGLFAFGLSRLPILQRMGFVPPPASITSPALPSTPTPSPLPATATLTPQPTTPQETGPLPTSILASNIILLSLDEGGYKHLYAYQPSLTAASQPLTLSRLTYGPWDDITPALSPDGATIAFASNRNGYWDLYQLDVVSGLVTRLTDTPSYEASPSWSPDGRWLAYEAYLDENLEVLILPVADGGNPIRLTNDPAADHSPAWSPLGRQVAFVSTRSGESEVWLADLDLAQDQRFRNISRNPSGPDLHPAWSPDGSALAWAGQVDGFHNLYIASATLPIASDPLTPAARYLGSGDWPVWSSDGRFVLSLLLTPTRSYLAAYPLEGSGLALQPILLPGPLSGLDWGSPALALPLRDPYHQAAAITPTPLWQLALTASPIEMGGRYQLVRLEDIEAPQPRLHDMVDESFSALRLDIAQRTGWDFLATLENAFVPITSPLDPGMGDDWLYTGRAFAINTSPIHAGWLAVVRQDFGSQSYWRVYVRPRFQDGSAGQPLYELPWDFYARYSADTSLYEQGGGLADSVPTGYWIDFTQLAAAYGWERQPALYTWRASYAAARFGEFVYTSGLDWRQAMLELYPQDVLITPSPIVPPTRTPSPTPRWYVSPTPTLTETSRPTLTPYRTATSTLVPTFTPTPTQTATITRTPTITATLRPSPTVITPTPTKTPFNTAQPSVTPIP